MSSVSLKSGVQRMSTFSKFFPGLKTTQKQKHKLVSGFICFVV